MGSNSTLTLYSIFGLALLLCAVTVGSIIRAWEMQTLISPASPSFVSVPKTAAPKPLSGPIAIDFSHNSSPSRTIKNQLSVNSIPMASAATVETATTPKWAQKTVTIAAQRRGCHLITSKILKEIAQDLSEFKCGLAHFFLHHTSASLTINENYDSDVRDDTETFLNRVVPEGMSAPWKHTLEGPDDMPAHIKSSMFGCSLTIPITNGKLNMGTWQFHGNSSACLGVAGEYGYVNTETQLPHVKW